MNSVSNVSLRQLSKRFSVGFTLVVVCLTIISIVIVSSVNQLSEEWIKYSESTQAKGFLISELNSVAGYGGAIHHFKNFVLRKDAPRLEKVYSGFDRAQDIIRQYRTHTISNEESRALDDIAAVFQKYSDATSVIEEMARNNALSAEIDKAVKIDDSPALRGIQLLDSNVKDQLANHGELMDSRLSGIGSLSKYGSVINTLALLAMLSCLLLTFRTIFRQIGGEPNQIMEIAQRIAGGDLDEALDGSENSTGIYGSVISMQSNLRQQMEIERATAAINERLKQALDNSSSNVMVADTDNTIVFINKASARLFHDKQTDIRSRIPNFTARDIVGSNIDVFHRTPAVQQQQVRKLTKSHSSLIEFGGSYFSLNINPIVMDNGERIGTIVEWFDKTEEIRNEEQMQQLVEAAANGDLGQRVNIQNGSEFYCKLGQSMNELLDVNDRAVSEMQSVFAAISKGDLTAKVKGDYQGVYQQLKNNTNSMVSQLTEVIKEVKNGAMVIATASSELISTNKNLNSTAEDGAKQAGIASIAANSVMHNVDAVATATVDLEASVSDISRNVDEAVGVASEAVTLAQSTNTQVRKLTTSSSDIGNVIKVINSIAEQTNLLALNATIEAARAGDAGKGFAVVANEVKELAKGTASATDEIAQKVKAIQNDSDTAVQAIGDISKIIETISNYQNTISDAVRNQGVATRRISENAGEAATGNVEITRTSERVSEGATSTVSGITQLQASAEELARMAVDLSDLVEGFQIDE